MKGLNRFFDNLQKDFLLFIFILALLEIYRAAFIYLMSDYISPDSTSAQIQTALFAGLRLSLKTAGIVTAFSLLFVTILNFSQRLRLFIGIFFSFIFSVLFMARFPYFQAYNATYGIEVVRGVNEDYFSLLSMFVEEYGLLWRFPVAVILTVICVAILSRLLMLKSFQLPEFKNFLPKFIISLALLIFLGVFGVFIRFGGSLTYGNGIN